jgi:predicted N-acetyltransferase YhbS
MPYLPDLSLAAMEEDRLIGTVQSWPVALHGPDGASTPLILVGPVAVDPGRQNRGVGRRMMEEMLDRADAQAADPLILIGDPEYYGRWFGFTSDATVNWRVPGPIIQRRLLARTSGRDLPFRGTLGPR